MPLQYNLRLVLLKKEKRKVQAKKSVSLLLAVCLLSSFFGFIDISKYKPERNEILLTFEFPTPVVTKGSSADSVTVSGLSQDGAPGEPVLPSKMVRALLPLGKDVQSIEVSTGNREVLAGEFHVGCGKTPLPIPPNDSGTDSAVDEPDATIYNSANPFPGKFFSDVMVQCLRGYKMVLLNLNPVQ